MTRGIAAQGCLLVLGSLCLVGVAIASMGTDLTNDGVQSLASSIDLKHRQLLIRQGDDSSGLVNGAVVSYPGGPRGTGRGGGSGVLGRNSFAVGDGGNAGKGGDGGNSGNSLFPQLDCRNGDYVLNNQCTPCVSKDETASTTTQRGVTCAKPFGLNNPTSCSFGFLNGLQIQKTPVQYPMAVSKCLSYKDPSVTVFVPVQGFRFFGGKVVRYLYDSITIAGAPIYPSDGLPLSRHYLDTVNGVEVEALEFQGTSKILETSKGRIVPVSGVVEVPGGDLLCFAATVEVCE